MTPPRERFVPALLAALCFQVGVGAGQTAFNDVDFGFETGTFIPTLSFAGGTAQVLQAPGSGASAITSALPSNPWVGKWTPSTITNGVHWVDSIAAFEGSKYLYLDGQDTSVRLIYGSGTGLPYTQALTPRQEYEVCLRVAAGTSSNQTMHVKWTDDVGGGFSFDVPIPGNNAWRTSGLSAIPWEKICFFYTPLSPNGSFSFGTSVTSSDILLMDGFSISPMPMIPEPTTGLLLLLGLALAGRRRR